MCLDFYELQGKASGKPKSQYKYLDNQKCYFINWVLFHFFYTLGNIYTGNKVFLGHNDMCILFSGRGQMHFWDKLCFIIVYYIFDVGIYIQGVSSIKES